MEQSRFEVEVERRVPVTADQAWEILATARGFQKMFPGIRVEGDWRQGGQVTWSGEWEGKTFRDEATILEYRAPKLFSYSYWTSFAGLPNLPENCQTITCSFDAVTDGTKVTIRQTNILTQESRDHSEKNWAEVLAGISAPLD